jgi:hypothetical protein
MFERRIYLQGPGKPQHGQMVEGISEAVIVSLTEYFAAVAYATSAGCRLLFERLRHKTAWLHSHKRWLIGIDFGRTEPDALKYLATLPNSEVRVPNANVVLEKPRFMPSTVFHSKVHIASQRSAGKQVPSSLAVFIGSANLTPSGLTVGYECGVLERWRSPLTASDRHAVRQTLTGIAHLERLWGKADPVEEILPKYRKIWAKSPPPVRVLDEQELPETGSEAQAVSPENLAKAKGLWVQIDELYKNRGPDRPGNQVDLPRGTRVFFGFPPDDVPRNTVFGELTIACEGVRPGCEDHALRGQHDGQDQFADSRKRWSGDL